MKKISEKIKTLGILLLLNGGTLFLTFVFYKAYLSFMKMSLLEQDVFLIPLFPVLIFIVGLLLITAYIDCIVLKMEIYEKN